MKNYIQITHSADVAGLLHDSLYDLDHEEMWAVFVNRDNRHIDHKMLTKGTLTYTPIDARTVIKHSLMLNATGVIIVHNHPSGNPHPSASDINETNRIRAACNLMDIGLLDHIIMANESYYSFADEKVSEYGP